jgi:cytochrome c oxidase subunit 2
MRNSAWDPVSPQAIAIRDLFTTSLLVCAAIFALVTVLILYCTVRFRSAGAPEPVQVEGHKGLEIAWTAAPILVLIWLLVLTARAMDVSDPPVDREPDVTVIGHQWWWEARYPSGVVTANEVHIPTGKALVVRLESADVIHDFWVPGLGRKMDAVPGRPTSIWLEADQPGNYGGTCAEYCGAQHAWMRILVIAETPEEFSEWQRHQLSPAATATEVAVARGAATFNSMTCVKCHAIGSAGKSAPFAPDLTHLATRATLGAGVLENTPANLALWLRDPQQFKEGSHMPDAQLSESQVADLVAYFETLR